MSWAAAVAGSVAVTGSLIGAVSGSKKRKAQERMQAEQRTLMEAQMARLDAFNA